MPTCTIDGRQIGPGQPTFIIAEIGINHGGDADVCAAMIEAAARAGADAAKLQIVDPDESYHPDTDSYREFKDKALPRESLGRLMNMAAERGIILFSTPGDIPSLALMVDLGMKAVKISSGLLTNLPLVRKAAATGLPLILSTGMARLEQVTEAVDTARAAGCTGLGVLQCTSLYPAPAAALNLRAMQTLAEVTGAPVGYSDHHEGALACVAAVAAGATIIEKHFSLNPAAVGADHAISTGPDDFGSLVREVRAVEAMLGSAEKQPTEEEEALRDSRYRHLVARREIAAGETIGKADLFLMRVSPGTGGLVAAQHDEVVGRRTSRAVARFQTLSTDDVEGFE